MSQWNNFKNILLFFVINILIYFPNMYLFTLLFLWIFNIFLNTILSSSIDHALRYKKIEIRKVLECTTMAKGVYTLHTPKIFFYFSWIIFKTVKHFSFMLFCDTYIHGPKTYTLPCRFNLVSTHLKKKLCPFVDMT